MRWSETPLYRAPIVVIDTETTGLDPIADRPIEVAAVRGPLVEGGDLVGWSSLVRWPQRSAPAAERVHGITRQMIDAAPAPDEVTLELRPRVEGACPVAYGWAFDALMLRHLRIELDRGVCVLALVRLVAHAMTLTQACQRWKVPLDGAHRAQADATATARLLPRVLAEGVTTGKLRRGMTCGELADLCAQLELTRERQRRTAPAGDRPSWHALTGSEWSPVAGGSAPRGGHWSDR